MNEKKTLLLSNLPQFQLTEKLVEILFCFCCYCCKSRCIAPMQFTSPTSTSSFYFIDVIENAFSFRLLEKKIKYIAHKKL